MPNHALLAGPAAVATAKVAIALVGAGVLAWEAAARRRGAGPDRHRHTRDWLLAAAAALAALGYLDFRPDRLLAQHGWEVYHHYVGAKYFRELGYDQLYRCTLLADVEAGFPIPPAERPVRVLETHEVTRAPALLADSDLCRSRFTPERWAEFSRDVAFLRAGFAPRQWAVMLTDHGLNATPLWIAIGRALASTGPATPAQLFVLTRLDQGLLALLWGALVWGFGWRPAAAALIWWGTAEPCESSWVVGAFLRHDWLAATGIGVALLGRGRPAAAGFALTWAAALRVFPALLVAAVALRAALLALRARRLAPAHRRFALGCLLALALAAPLSAAGTTGFGAWLDFARNSRVYLANPLTNFMGFATAVSYDPATSTRVLRRVGAEGDAFGPWSEAVRANFERRRPLYWAGVAAFALALAGAVVRVPDWGAAVLGVGGVVLGVQVASYYYALLLLYGLLAARHPLAGAGLLALSAATWGIADRFDYQDAVSAVQSAACAAFVLLVAAALWRTAPEPHST
jgi:hypothetical protein